MTMRPQEPIIFEFPDFPEEVQVAAVRRAKYFERGVILPKKYVASAVDLVEKLAPGYEWKMKSGSHHLYNTTTEEFVIKNSLSVGKPRFFPIAGNRIMRMHEHKWAKIVAVLKEYFLEGLQDRLDVRITEWPVKISFHLHTLPRSMNWDLDNLWIYAKCFQDALKESMIIPDDNVRRIVLPGAPEFIPVTKESDRKIVFKIHPDNDTGRKNHLMYYSLNFPTGAFWRKSEWTTAMPFQGFELTFTRTGKPGDLIVDIHDGSPRIAINIGKTEKEVGVSKALERVRHQCFQSNMVPFLTDELYMRFRTQMTDVFTAKGIPIMLP